MNAKEFRETIDYIRRQYDGTPEVGVVLGTGMGGLVESIEVEKTLAYNFIPHFPLSTVESHFGKLIFGKIGERSVVAMQGRMHYYEGYAMQLITYPIRIMKLLGVRTLFLSGASGSMNPKILKGDIMLLNDHNSLLLPENPLRGHNIADMGPRFPDMSEPYDPALRELAKKIAEEEGTPLKEGVYVSVQGPNLETPSEYRFLRSMGADAVGMSTVPEVIVANHMGMRVCAMTVITDECDPDNLQPLTVEEVIAVATATEPKLTNIMQRLIREFK